LPDNPSLERLRKEARGLQRSVRAGDPEALELVGVHHPSGAPAHFARFRLSGAQVVLARRYGFASWPALQRYVEVVERYRWDPDAPASAGEGAADRLCRLACLWYRDDGPERRMGARALLDADPSLSGATIWAAATSNDLTAIERLLAPEPSLASTRGGPFGWCPLFYLAYSRLDPMVAAEPVLGIARLLLDAGADPNEGYLWHGLPTPFTLLTGAFGHGELGPENQPPHPHSIALARMLLDAGADPNDGQTLYNRMFEADDDHLELLLAYGLGRGDGGPWKQRLGGQLASPPEMVRDQLDWAVSHDQLERVKLLVERGGVEVTARDDDGHTPAEVAALCGNVEIADYLLVHGAPALRLRGLEALVAAVMSGDRAPAESFGDAAIAELREAQPWLIVWAAARGRVEAVRLLLEFGLDVNTFGRADGPSGMKWQTALHTAAGDGNVDLVALLLSAGADPNLRDNRFGGTALGWARHGGQDAAARLLVAITVE
jgi:ankyrin repeat protein